jgi:hypothetical protein
VGTNELDVERLLSFGKSTFEIVDVENREQLYRLGYNEVKKLQDQGSLFRFTVTYVSYVLLTTSLSSTSFDMVSYYAPAIKHRLEMNNEFIDVTSINYQPASSLGLHLSLLTQHVEKQSARERNLDKLANILDDMKPVAGMINVALTDSNQRLELLSDHVEATDHKVTKINQFIINRL